MKSEIEIIQSVINGNISQYGILVDKHSGKIFALALSLLKNREDAEEVTQNVFLKAFQSLDKFRGESKFSSFLYRICYNESMNQIKSRKITTDIEDLKSGVFEINDDFYSLRQNEQRKFLSIALEELKPEFSMVLTLFYMEDRSYEEITELTGMSLSNVKVRLHRAKNALAEVLNRILKDEVNNLL